MESIICWLVLLEPSPTARPEISPEPTRRVDVIFLAEGQRIPGPIGPLWEHLTPEGNWLQPRFGMTSSDEQLAGLFTPRRGRICELGIVVDEPDKTPLSLLRRKLSVLRGMASRDAHTSLFVRGVTPFAKVKFVFPTERAWKTDPIGPNLVLSAKGVWQVAGQSDKDVRGVLKDHRERTVRIEFNDRDGLTVTESQAALAALAELAEAEGVAVIQVSGVCP